MADSSRIYVNNLSSKTTVDQLQGRLAKKGIAVDAIKINKQTGVAICEFSTPEIAANAAKELNGERIHGKTLSISKRTEIVANVVTEIGLQ
ncbi:hypothetical protein Syun_028652 [Stephania yunnanensis]|uniref:RRM domain-containing protein n=1 Tax=Stephania yunnanensis TaxID=152371 RepID=A0AAP0EBX5_9MAGN